MDGRRNSLARGHSPEATGWNAHDRRNKEPLAGMPARLQTRIGEDRWDSRQAASGSQRQHSRDVALPPPMARWRSVPKNGRCCWSEKTSVGELPAGRPGDSRNRGSPTRCCSNELANKSLAPIRRRQSRGRNRRRARPHTGYAVRSGWIGSVLQTSRLRRALNGRFARSAFGSLIASTPSTNPSFFPHA